MVDLVVVVAFQYLCLRPPFYYVLPPKLSHKKSSWKYSVVLWFSFSPHASKKVNLFPYYLGRRAAVFVPFLICDDKKKDSICMKFFLSPLNSSKLFSNLFSFDWNEVMFKVRLCEEEEKKERERSRKLKDNLTFTRIWTGKKGCGSRRRLLTL